MFFNNLAKEVNVIDVIAIVIILVMATLFQFVFHELPCPLCLLQRIGLLLMAVGFLMNLRFGAHPGQYGFSILAAIFTATVAMRQILLHIVPGSGSYGEPFLGLHLYTWMFVIAVLFIIWIAIQLLFEKQFSSKIHVQTASWLHLLIQIIFICVLIICGINIITTYLQCGWAECPDNPISYKI